MDHQTSRQTGNGKSVKTTATIVALLGKHTAEEQLAILKAAAALCGVDQYFQAKQ